MWQSSHCTRLPYHKPLSFTGHTSTDLDLLKPNKELQFTIATASPRCEAVPDPPFLFGGESGYKAKCCLSGGSVLMDAGLAVDFKVEITLSLIVC